jgi:hypothetical protein
MERKKGELMVFKFDYYDRGKIICTNPNDGKTWTLSGGQYAKLDDILDGSIQL